MDIIDQIKMRTGQSAQATQQNSNTASYNPTLRMNYLTMANATELTTEIVAAVIKSSDGVSSEVGGARMLKRDIASVVGARMAARLGEAAETKGSAQ